MKTCNPVMDFLCLFVFELRTEQTDEQTDRHDT